MTIHDFIQKTLNNDESAAEAFRDYVREKAKAILYPQPTETPPVVQPEPPQE